MTEKQKISLARDFFRQVRWSLEDTTDEIYAEIDPDGEFGDELPRELNLDTVEEVIRLGFIAKYGEFP